MTSLLHDNRIMSCKIFDEKCGHVTVKVRFQGENFTVGEHAGYSYRRKGRAQVTRDRRQAEAFRSNTTTQQSQVTCKSAAQTPLSQVTDQNATQTPRLRVTTRSMSTAAGYAADIEEVRAGDTNNEGDMVFSPMSLEPVTTPITPALLAAVSPFPVPDDPVTEHMDNTATSRGTSTSDVSSAISMDRERDCDSDNDSMNSTYVTNLGYYGQFHTKSSV